MTDDSSGLSAKERLAQAKLRASQLADEMLVAPSANTGVAQTLGGTVWEKPKPVQLSAEERWKEERERRKRIWEAGPNSFEVPDRQRPAPNGWEHSSMSAASKDKFLRLMGGRELAAAAAAEAAAAAVEAEDELTAAAAAEDDDSSLDEAELPKDCPVFELVGGDFVAVENTSAAEDGAGDEDSAVTAGSALRPAPDSNELNRELGRQYEQGKKQKGKEGLGAA
mmetsp:Transcript_9952/g.22392  ORF Transcript_9952/g.22392 Transcript_9952/m.22392 type:complete len:224 (+) Transcript_9952:82-753(+)